MSHKKDAIDLYGSMFIRSKDSGDTVGGKTSTGPSLATYAITTQSYITHCLHTDVNKKRLTHYLCYLSDVIQK